MLWTEELEDALRSQTDALWHDGPIGHVLDLPPSAQALLVWHLARVRRTTVLWVSDTPRGLESCLRDLRTLAPPDPPPCVAFPSWECLPDRANAAPDQRVIGARLQALMAVQAGDRPLVLATCVQALMELTLIPELLRVHTVALKVGDEAELVALRQQLAAAGYAAVPEIQAPGEAACRGGILDVWPLTEPLPLRLEFAGATLESVRVFDPASQRSMERRRAVRLPPANEWQLLRTQPSDRAALWRHLPPAFIVAWADMDSLQHHAAVYAAAISEAGAGDVTIPFAETLRHCQSQPAIRQLFIGASPDQPCATTALDFQPLESAVPAPGALRHPDIVEAARNRLLENLKAAAQQGQRVCFYFDSAGTRQRFQELYAPLFAEPTVTAAEGVLSTGFRSAALRLTVVAESDLYGRKLQRRRARPPGATEAAEPTGARIADWAAMEPGDLVVHVEHGIGRYLGLREIVCNQQLQEVLAIEYAEGARLYVPVAQAHLLTRYVGTGRRLVTLHQLGGRRWQHEKAAAERAIHDLAASLLETQAARATLPGYAFPPDTPWQHELEAAFPYEETDDQHRAIAEVKQDMEQPRPMDRLLCGDAGYGKTEVAIRAAFKVVMAGRQVAVLVPTTVLAQQHFQTFTERIAPFPVRIEMLSRFCSRQQSAAVLAGLRDGTVDIVIGTHALLQPHVRFRDLGLVIIDEEQRFGVLHKEQFKHLRRLVDVLTMTATPIPRTLYLSLIGARDLSTIQTPPQERRSVQTIVVPTSDAVIREAILRELNRGGQVYYLHNRVRSIELVRTRLQALVPEARIVVAHGQMPSGELAAVMRQFAAGEYDVLLCTTIVESGLDIPNANTILIDRADRFGLADLYQLRGRVGRSRHQAYAYLLLPPRGERVMDPTARKRIEALRHYSGSGAAFRLAMRDLEIRGAGNLLGAEQSGHIAAVGFGLYCQLLRRAIAGIKGEAPPPVVDVHIVLDFISLSPAATAADNAAIIPVAYIEDERLRVQMYRRVAETVSPQEIEELRQEFRDRFGPVPPECERLLKIAELRTRAAALGLHSVETREDRVLLKRDGRYVMAAGRHFRLTATRPDDRLDELLDRIRALQAGRVRAAG